MVQAECQSQALVVACGVTAHHVHLNYMLPINLVLLTQKGACCKLWRTLESTVSILVNPGVSVVKDLPADAPVQETWVRSLGWEDLLEKGMATHSSILAWEIP